MGKFLVATLILLASTVNAEETCRNLYFEKLLHGKYLRNHVIKRLDSENYEACLIKCYLESRCVSYNYHGDGICELNDSDHIQYPGDLLLSGYTVYQGTQNSCKDSKCKSNSTCLRGFTEKGYKCACPRGLKGEFCEKEDCFGNPETTEGGCCVFPFIYQGTSYQSCITVNRPTPWCATVPNTDVEQKWGDCKGVVHLNVSSEGADDPGKSAGLGLALVFVNGIDRAHRPKGRGMNIVAINQDATIHSTARFDTYGDPNAGANMSDYVNSLPIGLAVVVATQDSAERYYHAALPALKSIGATEPIVMGLRSSWLLVGYKGKRKSWITQESRPRFQGPARADLIIDLN